MMGGSAGSMGMGSAHCVGGCEPPVSTARSAWPVKREEKDFGEWGTLISFGKGRHRSARKRGRTAQICDLPQAFPGLPVSLGNLRPVQHFGSIALAVSQKRERETGESQPSPNLLSKMCFGKICWQVTE